ncbi:hypothetical protein HUU05_01450 [candidate division KSB1 bacterium]|nr:hypothetical protein [candidate division KSB1 bacterium]
MKAELEQLHSGVEVILIEGSRGIFDVKKDGKLIFSKYQANRFPHAGEISSLI